MGDIDDGGALLLHARQHREQPLDLALLECRRGFIEDEDAAFAPQRLGDRNQLALGEAQRRDRPLRIGIEGKLGKHGARLPVHAGAIDHGERAEASHGEVAERDVLGHRQGRNQAKLLRDGHDAGRDGIVRAREVAWLAGDEDVAAVGAVHAAENADQGRFPGAVLSDDGVDLAGLDVEVDAVERDGGAELLADACQARRRVAHRISAARMRPASSRR